MNGKKAKRLRRERREQMLGQSHQECAVNCYDPAEVKADKLKEWLKQCFKSYSGYRYISIDKPGQYIPGDPRTANVCLVWLHKRMPNYRNGHYTCRTIEQPFSEDSHFHLALRIDNNAVDRFVGLVMHHDGDIWLGDQLTTPATEEAVTEQMVSLYRVDKESLKEASVTGLTSAMEEALKLKKEIESAKESLNKLEADADKLDSMPPEGTVFANAPLITDPVEEPDEDTQACAEIENEAKMNDLANVEEETKDE